MAETVRKFPNFPRFSLKRRLLLLTTIAVLPAFAILVASQVSYRSTRSGEIDAYASRMTDVILTEVIRGMTGAATMMVAAARAVLASPVPSESCVPYLRGLMAEFPSVIDMVVARPDRTIVCQSGPSDGPSMQREIDQLAAQMTPGLWVGPYQDTPSGAALPIGIALRSDEVVEGYVALNAGVLDLQNLVLGANIPASSSTIVADGQGTVLLSVPANGYRPGDRVPDALLQYVFAEARGVERAPGADGRTSIIGYRPSSPQFPLAAIFMVPEAEMMAPVNRDALTIAFIAIGGAILAFALALFIGARFIAAPVRALHGAVSARRAGDRSIRSGLQHDNSELGMIAGATDALFDELDAREEAQATAERQRDIYAQEVQHRVKNLLGIVQVVARQSLLRGDPPPQVKAFEGRIGAIVRANAKLVAEHEPAGTLRALILEATSPFVGSESHRIKIEGDDFQLRSKPALALAMAMHELCTNAAKYGALSNVEGRVEVSWKITNGSFDLTWAEHEGPAVQIPTQHGFGTVLVTRMLEGETGGTVHLSYAPPGFRFALTAPICALTPGS